METLFKKYLGVILLVVALFCAFQWKETSEKKQIEGNKGVSVAQIVHVRRRGRVRYKFLYNKKWHIGHRPRNSNIKEGDYYKVEFDKTNPSTSNLIVSEQSLNPMDLVDDGIEISGVIERISFPSKTFLDLYVNYQYLNENYSVRTRMHKDSLPCGTVADCNNAKITFKISPYFPDLNSLYYESYDRSQLREKLEERFKE